MNLCSSGHDEICYEGRDCPCCELKFALEDEKNNVEKLKEDLDALTKKMEEL